MRRCEGEGCVGMYEGCGLVAFTIINGMRSKRWQDACERKSDHTMKQVSKVHGIAVSAMFICHLARCGIVLCHHSSFLITSPHRPSFCFIFRLSSGAITFPSARLLHCRAST